MTTIGVAFGQIDPEAKAIFDRMQHKGWMDDSKDLRCLVCDASLHGEVRWYLALDTEDPEGCASGYTCADAQCVRKAPVILRKDRKHW